MGMKVNGTSGLTFPDTTTLASAGQASVRAWVNFNGTGTVAIRAAYNVTSITDLGTGLYTVNFTTALPDANYAVAGQAIRTGAYPSLFGAYDYSKTTSGFSFNTTEDRASWGPDCQAVDVAIFR